LFPLLSLDYCAGPFLPSQNGVALPFFPAQQEISRRPPGCTAFPPPPPSLVEFHSLRGRQGYFGPSFLGGTWSPSASSPVPGGRQTSPLVGPRLFCPRKVSQFFPPKPPTQTHPFLPRKRTIIFSFLQRRDPFPVSSTSGVRMGLRRTPFPSYCECPSLKKEIPKKWRRPKEKKSSVEEMSSPPPPLLSGRGMPLMTPPSHRPPPRRKRSSCPTRRNFLPPFPAWISGFLLVGVSDKETLPPFHSLSKNYPFFFFL